MRKRRMHHEIQKCASQQRRPLPSRPDTLHPDKHQSVRTTSVSYLINDPPLLRVRIAEIRFPQYVPLRACSHHDTDAGLSPVGSISVPVTAVSPDCSCSVYTNEQTLETFIFDMIQINNVRKSYDRHPVLSGITLELHPGKIQGIVGENGSGKTTLFECIRNLTDYKGTIRIDKPAKIGYLPSEPYFYPNMKGIEYIEFCLSARKQKINLSEINRTNTLFELPLNEYAMHYSTGMKKKLLFLSLIMQQNDIFMLDEPFNGLDLTSAILFKHILLRLKEKNKTVFLSSHIIPSLTGICDCIFYIHQGMIQKTYGKKDFEAIEREIVHHSIHSKLDAIDSLNI
jgi:ABC-2 type transport system ATP-binding protein